MKTYRKSKLQILEEAVGNCESITCDKCGYVCKDPTLDGAEFLCYRDVCGYFAKYQPELIPYADGDLIEIDLCQDCKFELLGPWLRVTKDYAFG